MKVTLKAARVNRNLTQKEVAKSLNVSESTLRNYECGTFFPDVPVIKKIEELYGVEYKNIIFFTP